MEDITYRPAERSDLPAVLALLERSSLPIEDLRSDHLEQFLVGRAGERLIGAVGLEQLGDVGLLRSLAVAPEFRGRGLAHELWTRIQADARRRGIRRLFLLTTTAAGLFSRWGFRPVARDLLPEAVRATQEFRSLCPDTAAVMSLDLAAPDQPVS